MKLTILCYLLWSRWRGMKEAERQTGEKGQKSDGWWAIGEIKEVIIGDGSRLTASWDCSQLPDTTLRCSGEWNHWHSAFNTSLSRGVRKGGCGKVGLIFAHKSFYKILKTGPAERSTVHQIQMLYFKQEGRYTVGSTRKCFTESLNT